MSPSEIIATTLLGAVFVACLFRARLLALAIVPPLGMALVQWFDLADTSSASHPLRWIVPVVCAGLSAFAAWRYAHAMKAADLEYASLHAKFLRMRADGVFVGSVEDARHNAFVLAYAGAPHRCLITSILVLASCGPDLLALHPFFWARFQTWPLVPLTIAICATICTVLLAPERWVRKWTTT